MVKKIVGTVLGLIVVAILGIVAVAALTQPSSFKVERERVLAAPADAVFQNLVDFHRWQSWSPWEKLDPNMKKTHGGPQQGVGATYAWKGNSDAGEGKMTITEAKPNTELTIRLEFIDPFPATNTTHFALSPEESGTRVRWTMTGDNDLMGKIFGMFFDMDSMVGKDFERGLKALGQVSH